jgi:hypothetical protein
MIKNISLMLCLAVITGMLSGCDLVDRYKPTEPPIEENNATPAFIVDFNPLPNKMLGYKGLENFGFVKPGSYNIPKDARMLGADEVCRFWDALYVQYQTDSNGNTDAVIVEQQDLSLFASPNGEMSGTGTQFRNVYYSSSGHRIDINPIENQPRDLTWNFTNDRLYIQYIALTGIELVAWENDGKFYAIGYDPSVRGKTDTYPRMLALFYAPPPIRPLPLSGQ